MDKKDPDRALSLNLGPRRPPAFKIHCNEQELGAAGFQDVAAKQEDEAPAEVGDEEMSETEDEHHDYDLDKGCVGQEETLADTANVENGVQTEGENQKLGCESCEQSRAEMNCLLKENREHRSKVNKRELNEDSLKDDNEKVQYYTGLPSFALLRFLLDQVERFLPTVKKLSHFQMLLLTLMRLRMGLPVRHLCYLFDINHKTLSAVFEDTIHVLHARLRLLVHWPERHCLQVTMPHHFTETFGNHIVFIIKCLEICIERPPRVKARAQTFSHLKGTHTIKYVMGMTPLGVVSFLSKGWGGLASDKHALEESGLLEKLKPGDVLVADRGLDVRDAGEMMCVEVLSPSTTKCHCRLHTKDIEISHLREHIESVVSNACDKYKILHRRIPCRLLLPCEDEELAFVDKIVTVCCILVNICPSPVLAQ